MDTSRIQEWLSMNPLDFTFQVSPRIQKKFVEEFDIVFDVMHVGDF